MIVHAARDPQPMAVQVPSCIEAVGRVTGDTAVVKVKGELRWRRATSGPRWPLLPSARSRSL